MPTCPSDRRAAWRAGCGVPGRGAASHATGLAGSKRCAPGTACAKGFAWRPLCSMHGMHAGGRSHGAAWRERSPSLGELGGRGDVAIVLLHNFDRSLVMELILLQQQPALVRAARQGLRARHSASGPEWLLGPSFDILMAPAAHASMHACPAALLRSGPTWMMSSFRGSCRPRGGITPPRACGPNTARRRCHRHGTSSRSAVKAFCVIAFQLQSTVAHSVTPASPVASRSRLSGVHRFLRLQ